MSASLVGSEMCIRDRVPPPGPRERRRFVCVAERDPRRLNPIMAPPRRAVSYTHLTLPTICSV
eukprot:669372-Alexandrium_andersonii.AAC.1